jgi:hypothetical protein
MSFIGAAVASIAYWSLRQTWYVFSFDTPAAMLPGQFVKTGTLHANAVYDAFALTLNGTANGPFGPQAAISAIAGMPTPMVLIFASAALLVLAAYIRSTPMAIIALIVANLARGAIGSTRALVENPNYGGSYMFPARGLAWFSVCTLLLLALSVLVGGQVFMINRSEKAMRRAAGEQIPGMLDSVSNLYTGAFSRLSKNNDANVNERVNA